MNVCIVSMELKSSTSGIGYYTRMLVDGLAGRGHALTLVIPESERLHESTNACQVRAWKYDRTGSHANWLWMAPEIARQVRRTCSEQEFDVVYFTQARDALFCRESDVTGPLLGGVHDDYFAQAPWSPTGFRRDYVDWPQRWLYYQLVRVLERRTYRRMDGLVFNSRVTEATVTKAFRLQRPARLVCYYGIDGAQEPPADAEKEPILLFVGGNFERKGLPTLLRAMPSILQQHPEYRLVVVGRYTNQGASERLAADLGLQDQVLFAGYQDNRSVQAWHRRAKVFIMPSLMEGFGIVFLEAMRAGSPVIATPVGGIPEVVRDGENGLLVPTNQPEQLADTCNRLLSDAKLYDRLASGARQTVQNFTPQAMIGSTESFFEEALSKKSN